jgi:GNAT superfamily N-acetyltransferase
MADPFVADPTPTDTPVDEPGRPSLVPAPSASIRTDTSESALRAAIQDDLDGSGVRPRALPGERIVRTPTLVAYLSDVPSADANEVVRARFGGGPAADDAIEDTIGLFDGRPFVWWVGPDDEPADLSARLSRRGIVFLDDIPGMAMDLADLSVVAQPTAPMGFTIEPVLDATALAAFHAVLSHGFPEGWTDEAATAVIAAGTLRRAEATGHREPNGLPTRWLGSIDGRPVTTTRLHTGAGVAGIYAVVTVDDARRRGYGAAITRHVLLAARNAGFRIAVLQASVAGRGLYERLGFREYARYRLHEWRASPDQAGPATGEEER